MRVFCRVRMENTLHMGIIWGLLSKYSKLYTQRKNKHLFFSKHTDHTERKIRFLHVR